MVRRVARCEDTRKASAACRASESANERGARAGVMVEAREVEIGYAEKKLVWSNIPRWLAK